MSIWAKSRVIVLLILSGIVTFLPACADNETDDEENVVITIGNLSDLTGVTASVMEVMNMALEDLVAHFNGEHRIPGIELEVITYDGQYDPSRDIPGYEWLKERGADLLFTPVGSTAVTLKPYANQDEILLFTPDARPDALSPPGYVFCQSNRTNELAYTLLKWIAENDWDWKTNGPAMIGGAGWFVPYAESFIDGMEEYTKAHPEQFEWVGGYLTNFAFTWGPEVEALKECDYVFPPVNPVNFVKQYRDAGHDAKFIGTDAHAAFFDMVTDANVWGDMDRMLFLRDTRWWNEDGPLIDFTKQMLYQYHPDSAEEIMRSGIGYLAINNIYIILEIIENAIDTIGVEGFDSQALYNAAKTYSMTVDGLERYSFGETKRCMTNYYGLYEASGTQKDIFRVDTRWHPIIREP